MKIAPGADSKAHPVADSGFPQWVGKVCCLGAGCGVQDVAHAGQRPPKTRRSGCRRADLTWVAAAWERHRQRMFESQRPASDWLVGHLDAREGQTVLELAAGPGETGFLVAERIGPQGKLISTDVVPEMVEAARQGAAARGLHNVEFLIMDAQQIELPAASVNGVVCRFGLMLMPEPERALAEVRRVLRP